MVKFRLSSVRARVIGVLCLLVLGMFIVIIAPGNQLIYLDTQPTPEVTPTNLPKKMNPYGTEVDSEFADYRGAKAIEDAGFGWYRHVQVDWVSHEPTPGQYVIAPSAWDEALDAGIARATASGLEPIIVIRNSPAWATTSGITGCASITPRAYITFANFLNWVVSRYERPPYQVTYYELGNEPDAATYPPTTSEVGCWQHASDYVNMLKVVYPAVKQAHPSARIMNGGLVDLGAWAHEFITSGLSYVDALAYHAYDYSIAGKSMWLGASDPVSPANYLNRLNLIRSWLPDSDKPDIPIFMNEGAVIMGKPAPAYADLKRIQSYFAAFMTAQMTGEKLELYSWWVSHGKPSSFGTSVTEGDPYFYLPNTLHMALAFGISRVQSATYLTTTRDASGASIIKLRDAFGGDLWLMWNTNGANSSAFTYDFGFTPQMVWDVWGNVLPVTSTLLMDDPHRVVWVRPYAFKPK